MEALVRCLIALAVIASASVVQGKTLDEYVKEAEKLQESGNLGQAVAIMEQAVKEYPESEKKWIVSSSKRETSSPTWKSPIIRKKGSEHIPRKGGKLWMR